jgi:hypothetical protein
MKRIAWIALVWLAALASVPAQAAPALANLAPLAPKLACAALAEADLSGAVGAAVSNLKAAETAAEMQPFCKVTGTIAPKISFEVRLPMQRWTQRFLQTGCGGLCGGTTVRAEKDRGCAPVTNGEAALASTDMGHQGNGMEWGANPIQREDFAYRGVHLTTLAAKALIAAFYGQAPRYSYFAGCSDGGREALMAAQRYPNDFDGISAGAPALNFTVQNSFYHGWQALSNRGADGKAILDPADMPTLNTAAIKACDALDGLTDGQITDPRACRFNPAVALCKAAYEPGKCLTADKITAARKLYDGPRDERDRRLTVGGPMPGSELNWPGVFVPRQAGGMIFSEKIALDTIQNLLWTPNPAPGLTLDDFRFTSADFASLDPARRLYNADDPNLAPFAAHGGRLILWHGWSDQHISPLNTIDYFNNVGTAMGAASRDAMLRLFLLPGVAHCSGGDGPSDFPLLMTLMQWVEGGDAPTAIIAQRAPPTAGSLPPRSRPVYAYPMVARYAGKGPVDDAASFRPAPGRAYPAIDWLGRTR